MKTSATKRAWFTVWVFARLNTKRFFRDRLAIFFGILFPLIFLFVFGGIFGRSSGTSFKVALLDESGGSQFAQTFVDQLRHNQVFKIDATAQTMDQAKTKMTRGQLDAAITLPPGFGDSNGMGKIGGQATVTYTQNGEQAGQTIVALLDAQFKVVNSKYGNEVDPFTVKAQPLRNKRLSQFDYVFAGLLGFSVIGMGIFGPINVFPELKKQGILRRLHTTPLRVWQYFTSTMISQAIIGLVSLAVMFAVAMSVFHLHVAGNWLLVIFWLVLSITMILGIGLAIGGWARNERQAAPLANLIVFPMLFLSGTFFPRYLMPQWLQGVTTYLPLTPVIDGVRLITTEAKGIFDLVPQLGLMLGWTLVIYLIAFRVFRWE